MGIIEVFTYIRVNWGWICGVLNPGLGSYIRNFSSSWQSSLTHELISCWWNRLEEEKKTGGNKTWCSRMDCTCSKPFKGLQKETRKCFLFSSYSKFYYLCVSLYIYISLSIVHTEFVHIFSLVTDFSHWYVNKLKMKFYKILKSWNLLFLFLLFLPFFFFWNNSIKINTRRVFSC